MKFSVIIATANRPERLLKALAAVRNALCRLDGGEILVVDNGDRFPVESLLLNQFCGGVVEIRLLSSESRNKAKALNKGIAEARHDWLAFTDDDCLPAEDWLVEAEKYVTSSRLQVFGGRVVPGPLPEGAPRWMKPGRSGSVPKGPAIVEYGPMPRSGIISAKMQVPLGANFVAHKQVFLDSSGYDENLWRKCGHAALGSEDAEFGIRIRNLGEQTGYCHDAVVVHPVTAERARLLFHLQWAFKYGKREEYFNKDRLAFSEGARRVVSSLYGLVRHLLKSDAAAAVVCLMHIAAVIGEWRGLCTEKG